MSVSEGKVSEPISKVPRRTPLTVRLSPEFVSGLHSEMEAEQTQAQPPSGISGLLFGRIYDDVVIVSSCKLLKEEDSKSSFLSGRSLAALKANLPPASANLIGWCRICSNGGLAESDFDFHNRLFRRASDIAILLRPYGTEGASAEIYMKALKANLSNENCRHSTQALSSVTFAYTPAKPNLVRPFDPSIYLRAYNATDGFAPTKGSFWSLAAAFGRAAFRFGRRETKATASYVHSRETGLGHSRPVPSEPEKLGSTAIQEPAVTWDSRRGNLLPWAVSAAIIAGVLVGIALGVNLWPGQPVESGPSRTSSAAPTIAHAQPEPLVNGATPGSVLADVTTKTDAGRVTVSVTPPSPANREIAQHRLPSRRSEMAKERSATPPPAIIRTVAPEPERAHAVSKPLVPAPVSADPTPARIAADQTSQLQRSADTGNTLPTAAPAFPAQTDSMKAEPLATSSVKQPATSSPGSALGGETYFPPHPLSQVVPMTRGSGLMIFKEMAVEIQATVNMQGRVVATRAIQARNKISQQVIGAAIKAAEDWRFQPATLRGQPVESKYTIVFRFLPQDR